LLCKLAERGGFDPATKESGRRAVGPVKQQRGCSDDFQTYSIATDSNCRSKGKTMRTAEINDFGGKTKSTFAAEIPINPSVYSRIRYGPDLLSKFTIHGSKICSKVTKSSKYGHT
jgi:hypothetical protein